MADSTERRNEWKREWRRNGAGLMGVSFVVGGTWVSASQTFVSSQNGQLVHPSPWGWLLWVCIAGLVAGFYFWLSTYWSKLPMFGRKVAFAWSMGEAMAELRSNSKDDRRVYRVQMVGDERRPVPILAPQSYLLAQVRQALAKMREANYGEFRIFDIENLLHKMERTGTDAAYEPLRVFGDDSLTPLLESGEIVPGEKGYALGPEPRG